MFVDEVDLPNVYYFRQHGTTKQWYKVVYGSFLSRKEASDALLQLPQHALRFKPWVRSIGAIRSDSGDATVTADVLSQ